MGLAKLLRMPGGPFKHIDYQLTQLNSVTANLQGRVNTLEGFKIFISPIQTGTGSEQEITHSLGATPTAVLFSVLKVGTDGGEVTPGTHTTTKIRATATSGMKYQVIAIKTP